MVSTIPDLTEAELIHLRELAQRAVVGGGKLDWGEEEVRQVLVGRLWRTAERHHLTKAEAVRMVYGKIFREPRRCGCPTCKHRRGEHG